MGYLNQNLLLIPGLICDDEVWAYSSKHLADIANISILPMNEAATMQQLAAAVLKNSPDKFAIAGFSMGGYVALEVLRQAPERVTRIALLDTSSRKDKQKKSENRKVAISDCEEGRFGDLLDRFLPQLLTPKHFPESEMLSFQHVKKNSVVIILKINLFAWLGKKKKQKQIP